MSLETVTLEPAGKGASGGLDTHLSSGCPSGSVFLGNAHACVGFKNARASTVHPSEDWATLLHVHAKGLAPVVCTSVWKLKRNHDFRP